MKKAAVFASGTGTNFEALVKSEKQFTIEVLIVNNKDAKVIQKAKHHNIKCVVLEPKELKDDYEKEIHNVLKSHNIDFIILAGYMLLIKKYLLDRWQNKIINLHPSLLPNYKGINAIEKAYENNEKIIGITIHYVDIGMDTGKTIFQDSITVEAGDTLEDVKNKIQKLEHNSLTKTINKMIGNQEL